MSNETKTAPAAKNRNRKATLTIAFQEFNGVFLAKISDQKGQHTFDYGTRKCQAQLHALRNYRKKYLTPYFKM